MLRDISRQVQWQVNGVLTYIDEHDWKDICTAGLKKHNRIAPDIDGTGFVFLGMRTHKMKKSDIIELIEYMYWFGATRKPPVKWSDES